MPFFIVLVQLISANDSISHKIMNKNGLIIRFYATHCYGDIKS